MVARLVEVPVAPLPIARFRPLVAETEIRAVERKAEAERARFPSRAYWNINSTATGGGVAEMLRSMLAYLRGLGIDARWLVIHGTPEFFSITKRLHHALHGSLGDGSPLGETERAQYERVLHASAAEVRKRIGSRDLVILHDPQTAGLASALARAGATVIWRCHVGASKPNAQVDLAWAFLRPYLEQIDAYIFSRESYIPAWCPQERTVVIPPSIDPFSAKNQTLDQMTVRSILVASGLVGGPAAGNPVFQREDGTLGRITHHADVVRARGAPAWDAPLVVMVSRWDPLKDHIGAMRGFADHVAGAVSDDVQLVLAGPSVSGVADDPEGAATFNQLIEAWRDLPDGIRTRIHVANLPMIDTDENAALVNALQRHATVVVQKSLCEGFGLTVTEAMWKSRPIVASAVGGIEDQIEDGVHGLLLRNPTDLDAYARALRRLLEEHAFAEQLGMQAHQRARDRYLGVRHLSQYGDLAARIAANVGLRGSADARSV
jgi:trehalose synthase